MDEQRIQLAEEQIYEQQKLVGYDTREFTIQIIVQKYNDGLENEENEIYVPEYQRDFTWDKSRQSKFIESVILGLPIPLIFVAENHDGRLEIVDGSQRTRTLSAFLNDELTLSGLEKMTRLNGFKFSDLPKSRQRKIGNIPMRMIVLSENATDEVRKDMFERINQGSDLLKPMEKRKGIYPGLFSDLIYKKCAKSQLFIELTPMDHWLEKRQEREELILRYFALSDNNNYERFPSHTGLAKYLDHFLESKNNELAKLDPSIAQEKLDNYYKDFIDVINFVEKYFVNGFRRSQSPQVKRLYFESLSVGVHAALKVSPSLVVSAENIDVIQKDKYFQGMIMGKVEKKYTPGKVKERVEFIKNKLLQVK